MTKNLTVSREAAARIARQIAENSGVVTVIAGSVKAAPEQDPLG